MASKKLPEKFEFKEMLNGRIVEPVYSAELFVLRGQYKGYEIEYMENGKKEKFTETYAEVENNVKKGCWIIQ